MFLINNYAYMTRQQIADKFELPVSVISRYITKLKLKKPKKNTLYKGSNMYLKINNESSAEFTIERILLNNKIPYERNFHIKQNNKFYEIDFLLSNKLGIEIQGDYWHGNSKIYDFDDLSPQQINKMTADANKELLFNDLGYKILYLWEMDIINNIDECENRIKQFILENANN